MIINSQILPALGGLDSDSDYQLIDKNDSPVRDYKFYFSRYQTVVVLDGQIYISSDYGNTWTAKDSDREWRGVSLSSTGQYQTATAYNDQIYISSDYGNTWTAKDSDREWYRVSLSSTGQYQTAPAYGGQIYISSDYGNTWTAKDSDRNWFGVSLSSTGQYQTVTVSAGKIYISSDYGNTWTAKDSDRLWHGVSLSSTGQYQVAPAYGGKIYTSSDYGNTWTAKDSDRDWYNCSISYYEIKTGQGRLNFEIKDGNLGVGENAPGNNLKTYTLATGTNKVIGQCEDIENNAVIYFIYNSNDDHRIVRYEHYNNSFTLLSESSVWNFSTSYPIINPIIVGSGDDTLLCWTDKYNEPRQASIYHLINTYATLDAGKINLVKSQPSIPALNATLISGSTNKNFIKGKIFQVTYRYVYDIKQKSKFASYSNFIYGNNVNGIFSSYLGENESSYNGVRLTLTRDYDNIDSAEIAVREVDIGSGVFGNWMLYDKIDFAAATYSYDFYNDKIRSVLDQSEFIENYDDVPKLSSSIELMNNNRIVLGGIKRGFDNITLDITLAQARAAISESAFLRDRSSIAAAGTGDFVLFGSYSGYSAGYYIYIYNPTSDIGEKYIIKNSFYYDTDAEMLNDLVVRINTVTELTVTASNVSNTTLRITNGSADTIIATVQRNRSNTSIHKTLKSNVTHYFALQYMDYSGRQWMAQVDDDCRLYVQNQSDVQGTYATTAYKTGLKYTITHLPPTGATSYKWLYGGSNIQGYYWVPMCVKNNYALPSRDYYKEGGFIHIKLNSIISRIYDFRKCGIPGYFDPKAGDKIRIIGALAPPANAAETNYSIDSFDEDIDLDILDYINGEIIVPDWNGNDNTSYINGDETDYDTVFFEIYRLRQDSEEDEIIYREIGNTIPITGGYHTATDPDSLIADEQNQTIAQPAIGAISFADSYAVYSSFYDEYIREGSYSGGYIVSSFIESQSLYEFMSSEQKEVGRINIVDDTSSEVTEQAIIHGGVYSDKELSFNELNKFSPLNTFYLNEKHGQIYDLKQEGYTLNVFQREKITPISIGRIEQSLADGSTQYVASDKVFGSDRPLIQNIGTTFPQAVVKNNRYLYFPDIYAGEVYRKAPNGIEAISKYKMSKYFRNKFRKLISSGVSNISMYGGWDPVNKLYVLTMIDSSDTNNNETIAFHEPSNRWITFYSFTPEMYSTIGESVFVSFSSGSLYIHNDEDSNRCNFYGTDYDSEVWVICNEYPTKEKIFNSLSINSNKKWYAPDEDDILVITDSTVNRNSDNVVYKGDMSSLLTSGMFDNINGLFKAPFKRDAKTHSIDFSQIDLHTGRRLKGKNILIKLKNSDISEVYLREVIVTSNG